MLLSWEIKRCQCQFSVAIFNVLDGQELRCSTGGKAQKVSRIENEYESIHRVPDPCTCAQQGCGETDCITTELEVFHIPLRCRHGLHDHALTRARLQCREIMEFPRARVAHGVVRGRYPNLLRITDPNVPYQFHGTMTEWGYDRCNLIRGSSPVGRYFSSRIMLRQGAA